MVMRLWTWQKEGFDIRDENTPVKSFKYTEYINTNQLDPQLFKRQYAKLIKIIETSQFHWYYTDEIEAKTFQSPGTVLWEVNVPVEKILRKVCKIAWSNLLNRPTCPDRLFDDWKRIDIIQFEKFKQDFYDFWNRKSEEELWEMLFLETCVDGCTTILLNHPLDDSWIVKDPNKEVKWWGECKYRRGPKTYDCPLPFWSD